MNQLKQAVDVETQAVCAVLDTNIWLDWLVFNDASVRELIAAYDGGRLRIVSIESMRTELAQVITRDLFKLDTRARQSVMTRFDQIVNLQTAQPPGQKLVCTDRDDQQFIDLAVDCAANFLLTKDKALLALRRRAHRQHGLRIQTLRDWQLP